MARRTGDLELCAKDLRDVDGRIRDALFSSNEARSLLSAEARVLFSGRSSDSRLILPLRLPVGPDQSGQQ